MILVSAGHHPYSKGASYGSFNEFDEAQLWVSLILNHLGGKGMLVPPQVLREKVRFINNHKNPQLAIEIHFNSAKDSKGWHVGRGSETLYYPGSTKGRYLANRVQSVLGNIFAPNRGAKAGWYRMNPDNGPDFFLARTRCPSLIIEPEFIHLQEKITEGRPAACSAIASTLLECIKELKL